MVTGGLGTHSAEFREVARLVAAVDTLEGFLREMRALSRDGDAAADARGAAAREARWRGEHAVAAEPGCGPVGQRKRILTRSSPLAVSTHCAP